VVQQVFSMGMLAHTLGVLTDGAHQDVSKAHQLAEDLQNITEDVLADLRSMVTQLRPVRATGDGLVPALQELAARTHRQTGTEVRLDAPSPVPDLDPDLVEDVFLIAAEAIRNAVKHAQAFTIHVAVETPPGRLLLTVHDDGGPDPAGYGTTVPYPAAASAAVGHDVPHDGAGLSIMRQRGERWGGSVDIDLDPVDGGSVSVSIPLATPTSETEQA
jgi:signal transduction histidine kinase